MSNLKMAREVLKDATKSNLPASTEVFLNKWAPKLIDELEHLEQAADRMAEAGEIYLQTGLSLNFQNALEAYQSLRAGQEKK